MKQALLFLLIALQSLSLAVWSNPMDLGSPPNSNSVEESAAVSMQNQFMVFGSNRAGGSGNEDLWYSAKSGSTWLAPVNLGTSVNTNQNELAPMLTLNDSMLYFASNTGAGGYGNYDIWMSSFNAGVAGPKSNLGSAINTSSVESCPVLTSDGNVLFFASNRAGGSGNWDIWRSTKSGSTWSVPVNLGNPPNSNNVDKPCWVSADGNTLVFSSNRGGGSYGGYDLWVTTFSGGNWSTPINMNTPVNSNRDEEFACIVSSDGFLGGFMYLTRDIDSTVHQNIMLSYDSGYLEVIPSSLGRIKSAFR